MDTLMNAKAGESPSLLRQRWLEQATADLRKLFHDKGYTVPKNVRVSIGWGYGGADKIAGQCWPEIASSDKHIEIFIAPSCKDGVTIVATLTHELVHAVVGNKAGHKGPFKQCAVALGLKGKMTATTAGEELKAWAVAWCKKHGAYPAGSLSKDKGRKKQSTRLLKCECGECGYTVRVTKKWLDEAGAPYCGVKSHGRMDTDYDGSEEEGDDD